MEPPEASSGEGIELRQIPHEPGVPLPREIVRDGGRSTRVDLDPATAPSWARTMVRRAETAAEVGRGRAETRGARSKPGPALVPPCAAAGAT